MTQALFQGRSIPVSLSPHNQAMGRYAQARRRGTAHASPPLTPTPELEASEGSLSSLSASVENSGGFGTLYFSAVPGGPYEFRRSEPWEAVINWGEIGGLPAGYYVATETGNGIDYNGVSGYSNEVDTTE